MSRHRPPQPVFVDRSGRRRRLLTAGGLALGVALLTFLGLLVAGATSGGSVPLPGWPDAGAKVEPESTGVPSPAPVSPTTGRSPGSRRGTSAPAPSGPAGSTDRPGRGDEHRRTARPSKPGRPG